MSILPIKPIVIVPGHAVYVGKSQYNVKEPTSWLGTYVDYKNNEEPALYIEHIRQGAKRAISDNALLMFSGGQTRKSTPVSEAKGYFTLAQQLGLTDGIECDLEQYARDSFENLLFSIYRYQAQNGFLPEHITAVGFSFKSARFQFHFETILKNSESLKLLNLNSTFNYLAVNNPPEYVLNKSKTNEKRTLQAFYDNPFGNKGFLLEKRILRNPWNMKIPYPNYG